MTEASSHPKLDVSVPHSARVWNYWLGGKDNFQVDRDLGAHVLEVMPEMGDVARASRAFLERAVTFLATDAGIRQFLDIGTGLPTANNTHQVAQRVAPEARIVYVDNDPLVLAHARALLTSSPEGVTDYIDADVHEPAKILDQAAAVLDFDQPVAVMLLGILGHIVEDNVAWGIVRELMAAVPSGSYLVINDGTNEVNPATRDAATEVIVQAGPVYVPRTTKQITEFFTGLELLEPGVVSTPLWRPVEEAKPLNVLCGVARKP